MVIKVKGKLKFNIEDKTKKHERQNWKKVAMVMLKCDIDDYYSWFLSKRYNLNFVRNLRPPHVTIISDKISEELYQEAAKIFNDKEITIYYEIEPRTNAKHWWLRVYSPEAESIRDSLGLSKEPYFGFHLTIGYMNEKNIDHSKYILETIKLFNKNEMKPRIPLSEHEIIDYDLLLKDSNLNISSTGSSSSISSSTGSSIAGS